MMLQSIDFPSATSVEETIAVIPATTPVAAGVRLFTKKKSSLMALSVVDATSAPPVYDYPNRDDEEFSGARPNTQGIHRVYGGEIRSTFGYHGHVFAAEENVAHFNFLPCTTAVDRKELDALVQQWVVPTNFGKPVAAEGIFCGQITCRNPHYAVALMASVLQVRVFAVTPKFRTDYNNGRVKGHVEFWVERGNAAKFISRSKGLVCCEDGGFYVAKSQQGSAMMQGHSLHVPPTKVGIPQWPVTLEPRKCHTH